MPSRTIFNVQFSEPIKKPDGRYEISATLSFSNGTQSTKVGCDTSAEEFSDVAVASMKQNVMGFIIQQIRETVAHAI